MSARRRRSKSSSTTRSVLFVTAGDLRRVTGGNLYARRMVAALRRAGLRVDVLDLRDGGSATRLRALNAGVVIVDTLAAGAAGELAHLRARGVRVCTLALMARGAVKLGGLSDLIIAVSRALAGELRRSDVRLSRIAVVPPGVDRVPPARRARPQKAGPIRVLCVANWTKEKGIRTLLAAIEWLPDVHLDLVGDAPDRGYARQIRADLRRTRYRRRVRALGVKRGRSLARLYERASLFVLPSIRESYGMAVSEALAAGLPVIACDIPATREVAGAAAILVPRGRVDPLADAIDRLAHDARLRERLSTRAIARAKKLPTWAASERGFVREIRALLRA